jgi:hypothetical protein
LYVQDDVTNLQLTLSDASGKILYRNTLKTAGAGQQVPLPVTTLAKGMYLLKVQSDKGSSTEKIIVQ